MLLRTLTTKTINVALNRFLADGLAPFLSAVSPEMVDGPFGPSALKLPDLKTLFHQCVCHVSRLHLLIRCHRGTVVPVMLLTASLAAATIMHKGRWTTIPVDDHVSYVRPIDIFCFTPPLLFSLSLSELIAILVSCPPFLIHTLSPLISYPP